MAKHLIVELYGCDADRTTDIKFVEKILKEIADIMGVKIIQSLSHIFGNTGAVGVIIVSDSYYGIRTFPEHNYVAVELYSSDENTNYEKPLAFLIRKFGATKYSASEIKRGNLEETKS